MNIKNIALILFLLAAVSTILVYFKLGLEENKQLFWICGAVATVFYLIFRFSKRQK
jgi:uncharacterized membrane protein HdeD (DUF308 family)